MACKKHICSVLFNVLFLKLLQVRFGFLERISNKPDAFPVTYQQCQSAEACT